VDVKDSTSPALHGDAIRSIAFSVDGSLFATVGDDKRVKLWDAKTWTCVKTMYVWNSICNLAFQK
jgi:WD40 repeat protein